MVIVLEGQEDLLQETITEVYIILIKWGTASRRSI